MQWLSEFYQTIVTFTNANPAIGGAIMLTVSGMIGYMVRDIPKELFDFFKRQVVTSLTLNNVPYTDSSYHFEAFGFWLGQHKWSAFSRNFTINPSHHGEHQERGNEFSVGTGTHIFFHKGRLFWCTRSQIVSHSGSSMPLYEFRISTIGRSVDSLKTLFEEFRFRVPDSHIKTYVWRSNEWVRVKAVQKRPLSTVVQKEETTDLLHHHFKDFLENEDWYHQRAFACKKTIILHGPPGTGKTSLIKAFATHYNLPFYLTSLNVPGQILMEQLNDIPRPAVVLFEDVTDCQAVLADGHGYQEITKRMLNKEKVDHGDKGSSYRPNNSDTDLFGITKSELLNVFDGVVPLEGLFTFLTTNHLERIDPVFLRKGRVDDDVYIGKLEHPEICRYLKMCFPGFDMEIQPEFKPITGCDLRSLFIENRDSVHDTITAIRDFEQEGLV